MDELLSNEQAPVIPDMLPPSLGEMRSETPPPAEKTEFFTPMIMIIFASIVFVAIMSLWVGGSVADQDTHKRLTGNDVTLPEAMFNDLGTPDLPKD